VISKVVIIGAGTMGVGISKLFQKHNLVPSLFSARKFISDRFAEVDTIENAELIIEASAEDFESKLALLKKLSYINSTGIIATTTSSLSISDLSKCIYDPRRFCGIHFMNPATVIPVIEFTPSVGFLRFKKDQVIEFLESIDRIVFETLDQPGFVLNAMLFPFLNRSIYMLESSSLLAKDIDQIMMRVCGHKLGPLATLDLIGLDVSLEIINILHSRDPIFNLPPASLLTRLVKEMQLGKKVGAGFYDY
jgi:3-hydroxybutyryl-CoA dehydrogenase